MAPSSNRRTRTPTRPSRDDRLDRVFAALSDRTRRALVTRLKHSGANITELAEPFEMTLPGVSKHLRVLEDAGLVVRTVAGREHRFELDAAAMREADHWLATYRIFWDETLEALADFAKKAGKR